MKSELLWKSKFDPFLYSAHACFYRVRGGRLCTKKVSVLCLKAICCCLTTKSDSVSLGRLTSGARFIASEMTGLPSCGECVRACVFTLPRLKDKSSVAAAKVTQPFFFFFSPLQDCGLYCAYFGVLRDSSLRCKGEDAFQTSVTQNKTSQPLHYQHFFFNKNNNKSSLCKCICSRTQTTAVRGGGSSVCFSTVCPLY